MIETMIMVVLGIAIAYGAIKLFTAAYAAISAIILIRKVSKQSDDLLQELKQIK